MTQLSRRQRQILDYIHDRQQNDDLTPSVRDIAGHFGFKSPGTVSGHLSALRRKGALANNSSQARSFRILSPLRSLRKRIVDIPLLGSIPAGFPDYRSPENRECVSVDLNMLEIKPTRTMFALEIRGDSMIGRHICDRDVVILDFRAIPKTGDVVAALVDGESTLKTFIQSPKGPYLKAENPKYPKLIPAAELVIQGVMIALIRRPDRWNPSRVVR
jgi:repressor LexA